jgi:hypothetical protein
MRAAHFRVVGRLDRAGGVQEGTVTIDRLRQLFCVRPLRRRRFYELPLDVVADLVVHKVVLAELAARRAEKRARRGRR